MIIFYVNKNKYNALFYDNIRKQFWTFLANVFNVEHLRQERNKSMRLELSEMRVQQELVAAQQTRILLQQARQYNLKVCVASLVNRRHWDSCSFG